MKRMTQAFLMIVILAITGLSAKEQQREMPLADISFFAADVKYNEEQGVKICEVQRMIITCFGGYDAINWSRGLGCGLIGEKAAHFLSQYQNNVWFVKGDVADHLGQRRFLENHWIPVKSIKELIQDPIFLMEAKKTVHDPYNVSDYHGVVYARKKSFKDLEKFKKEYPGIIVLGAANINLSSDKYTMSVLFSKNKILEGYRPKWKLYKKQYSKHLAQSIINDIQSDFFVIKPRASSLGRGVIIVERKDLDKTLKYILGDKKKLKKNPDASYSFWGKNSSDFFLVEEFVSSIPVYVSHLGKDPSRSDPYNGTMRVVFALLFHQQQVHVECLAKYWALPEKSLSDTGSLNEKNKTYMKIPYFMPVEPAVGQEAERQLCEAFTLLYKQMLGIP